MEIPVVVDERERERERVTNSGSFPRRHKFLFGLIVIVGVLLYAAFNVWVYQASKSGKTPSPRAIWQQISTRSPGFPEVNPTKSSPIIPPAKQDLAPPDIGPGKYACDEYGICNNYEDAKRVGCPKTYADPHCLNECGDKKVQCLKPK